MDPRDRLLLGDDDGEGSGGWGGGHGASGLGGFDARVNEDEGLPMAPSHSPYMWGEGPAPGAQAGSPTASAGHAGSERRAAARPASGSGRQTSAKSRSTRVAEGPRRVPSASLESPIGASERGGGSPTVSREVRASPPPTMLREPRAGPRAGGVGGMGAGVGLGAGVGPGAEIGARPGDMAGDRGGGDHASPSSGGLRGGSGSPVGARAGVKASLRNDRASQELARFKEAKVAQQQRAQEKRYMPVTLASHRIDLEQDGLSMINAEVRSAEKERIAARAAEKRHSPGAKFAGSPMIKTNGASSSIVRKRSVLASAQNPTPRRATQGSEASQFSPGGMRATVAGGGGSGHIHDHFRPDQGSPSVIPGGGSGGGRPRVRHAFVGTEETEVFGPPREARPRSSSRTGAVGTTVAREPEPGSFEYRLVAQDRMRNLRERELKRESELARLGIQVPRRPAGLRGNPGPAQVGGASGASTSSLRIMETEMAALRAVQLRERFLSRVREAAVVAEKLLAPGFVGGNDAKRRETLRRSEVQQRLAEVVSLLGKVRGATAEVVESISAWRRAAVVVKEPSRLGTANSSTDFGEGHAGLLPPLSGGVTPRGLNSAPRPFIYEGINYSNKLTGDLDGFDRRFPCLVRWLGFSLSGNPFVLPPAGMKDHNAPRLSKREEENVRTAIRLLKDEMAAPRREAAEYVAGPSAPSSRPGSQPSSPRGIIRLESIGQERSSSRGSVGSAGSGSVAWGSDPDDPLLRTNSEERHRQLSEQRREAATRIQAHFKGFALRKEYRRREARRKELASGFAPGAFLAGSPRGRLNAAMREMEDTHDFLALEAQALAEAGEADESTMGAHPYRAQARTFEDGDASSEGSVDGESREARTAFEEPEVVLSVLSLHRARLEALEAEALDDEEGEALNSGGGVDVIPIADEETQALYAGTNHDDDGKSDGEDMDGECDGPLLDVRAEALAMGIDANVVDRYFPDGLPAEDREEDNEDGMNDELQEEGEEEDKPAEFAEDLLLDAESYSRALYGNMFADAFELALGMETAGGF